MKIKRKRKFIFSIFIIASIVFIGCSINAVSLPKTIYETKKVNSVAPGVKHEHIERFSSAGWWNINIIRYDMQNKHNKLGLLYNQNGIPNRGTVSSLVDNQGAVAGINGDYFNYSPLPSPMGTMIDKGEMITSPIELAYGLPNFIIDKNKNAYIDYLNRGIALKNIDKGTQAHINTMNKVDNSQKTLTVLNENWGNKSIGTRFHRDMVEIVVSNNKVIDKRINQGPTNIPKDGFVVAGRGSATDILGTFDVGDTVELILSAPNLEDIDFAIGAGSIILKDGKTTVTNIHSSGYHPRTGIGINEDNTEAILVTVDGRSKKYSGIGQEMFGALLKDLGAYNAVNLDGGGSTTMAIKKPKEDKSKVVNIPSGGAQRKVVNGVGVFSEAPKGELSRIEVICSEPEMFVGTSRNISIKGFDGYDNEIPLKKENLKVTVDGVEASFDGNTFKPKTSGIAKLTANYNDFTHTLSMPIYKEIKNVYTNLEESILNVEPGKSYKLPHIYGEDINGLRSRIYLSDAEISLSEDIGTLENGIFTASETPINGTITIKVQDGIEVIQVLSEGAENQVTSSIEKTSSPGNYSNRKVELTDPNGFKFVVYSESNNTDNIWGPGANDRLQSKVNNSDLAISLNGFTDNFKSGLTNKGFINASTGYQENRFNDMLFLNIDTRKGGLITSNNAQWDKLKKDILELDDKNIIITTHRPLWGPGGFSNNDEAGIFHRHLMALRDSGKEVFVIHSGPGNANKVVDGIRYIGIHGDLNKNFSQLKEQSIVEFTVNYGEVTYTVDKVFGN